MICHHGAVPTPAAIVPDREALCAVGLAAGLDRVGFASAAVFETTRAILVRRRAEGRHGGMAFTYRNPDRSTDPRAVLDSAQALVVGARAYPAAVPPPPSTPGPVARIARYATDDHYAGLRRGLEAVAAELRAAGWTARVVLDDNALVDRAAAHRAGIGWYGKNSNILIEGLGSWFVLGSVVTDAPLRVHEVPLAMAVGCGACTRCVDRCPTGAIVEPGVVDAGRCLAWLVQAEGVFPVEHRVALGDRLYGCDECQEVCPPAARTERSERAGPAGVGAHVPPGPGDPDPGAARPAAGERSGGRDGPPALAIRPVPGPWVDVLALLEASDEELLTRFGRWYIPRREPRYLRRNALIVLGNAATFPVVEPVAAALARWTRDSDPIVRGAAIWAARRLHLDALVPNAAEEPDEVIRVELAGEVPVRAGSSGPERPPSRGADRR